MNDRRATAADERRVYPQARLAEQPVLQERARYGAFYQLSVGRAMTEAERLAEVMQPACETSVLMRGWRYDPRRAPLKSSTSGRAT